MKKGTSKSNERKGMSHTQKITVSSEKKQKNISYTQGDKIPDSIDDILFDLSLKKPKRAYNYYIQEMMEMSKEKMSMIETVQMYAPKWHKMSASDRKKFQVLAEEDIVRYQEHLELVKRHIIAKPLKETATAYRIFLDEARVKAQEANEDPKEAQKQAADQWKNLTLEDKRAYNEKKKEHILMYENLKKSHGAVSDYMLFMRDQMAAARSKGETASMKECAEKWGKAKDSVKEKYASYAEEERAERLKQKDLYEIAFNMKPKRPQGAYKFFLIEAAKDGKLGANALADGRKLWGKLNTEAKDRYLRMAQKEKLGYIVKKMEYDLSQRKNNTSHKALSPLNLFMADMKGQFVVVAGKQGGGFFDQCYKKWNKMDESAKKKYFKASEEQKVLAEKSKEEIKARMYQMPKRAMTSYTIYVADVVAELRLKNPKMEQSEIFKLAGEKWQGMTDKEKAKFVKQGEKSKELYESLVAEFKEKGYYNKEATPKPMKTKKVASRSQSAGKSKRAKKIKE